MIILLIIALLIILNLHSKLSRNRRDINNLADQYREFIDRSEKFIEQLKKDLENS